MHLCSACRRHIKVAPCPFCGEGASQASAALVGPGLSRTQLLAGVALAGALAAGCTDTPPVAPAASSSGGGNETMQTVYGAPPLPPLDAAAPLPAPDAGAPRPSTNTQAPAYGGPPPQRP